VSKWILPAVIVIIGALTFAACGDDNGDPNTQAAADDGSLPRVSDDQRASAVGEYRVTVSFNEEAVQADLDEIGRLLTGFDEGAEYAIQESFPSTGVANLVADVEDFCETIVSDLESRTYVTDASCGPQLEPGDIDHEDPAPSVDSLPPVPDDAPPPATRDYRVTVSFNETAEQAHLDEIGARIRDFDPDAEYVIQESFPPTGVANVLAGGEDFCIAIIQELEAETFVTAVSCGPQLEPGDDYPDEPVVNDLE
jgi:hypothetical protein